VSFLPEITPLAVVLDHVIVRNNGVMNGLVRTWVLSVAQVRFMSVPEMVNPYGTIRAIIQTIHQLYNTKYVRCVCYTCGMW